MKILEKLKFQNIFKIKFQVTKKMNKYINAPVPKNRENTSMWELQVLKVLGLSSVDLL
jgi:hypothetical protein